MEVELAAMRVMAMLATVLVLVVAPFWTVRAQDDDQQPASDSGSAESTDVVIPDSMIIMPTPGPVLTPSAAALQCRTAQIQSPSALVVGVGQLEVVLTGVAPGSAVTI